MRALNGLQPKRNLRRRGYTARLAILAAIVGIATSCDRLQTAKASQKTSAQPSAQSNPPQPDLRRQATPRAVVDEHLDALNKGDWQRLMAQYPADVEFFLPGGY
jgi:hypothetical protein